MIFADMGSFRREPLISGRASDKINRFFGLLGRVGGAEQIEENDSSARSQLTPLEDRLRFVQDRISEISMHLPRGFATGLNRQFANLMDDDAWEDSDELVSPRAVTAFILTLLRTRANRRPGIGTNGRGSITASWTEGANRLTVECLPDERISFVLSRVSEGGEIERAAFGPIHPHRILQVLGPFNPEVWFDR